MKNASSTALRNKIIVLDFSKFKLYKKQELLTPDEEKVFRERLKFLEASNCWRIYRGDSRSKMLERYQTGSLDEFNHKLFLLGNKGKFFLKEVQKKVKSSKAIKVSETNDTVFGKVFEMLWSVLSEKKYGNSVQQRIESFKLQENSMSDFFTNKDNKAVFVERLHGLSQKEKILIRNYYLTLLHQMDQSEYYPVSFFLSVTKDFVQAQKFTPLENVVEDDIIFFGWIPKEITPMLSNTQYQYDDSLNILGELGLPYYGRTFFEELKEFSLVGGLLPHYLLGYLYTKDGQSHFEINSNLFDIKEDNWIRNGFPIDQDGEFWETVRKTDFDMAYMWDTGTDEISQIE